VQRKYTLHIYTTPLTYEITKSVATKIYCVKRKHFSVELERKNAAARASTIDHRASCALEHVQDSSKVF